MIDGATERRLFLLVTSGQNVANVAPVLEAGSPERGDAIVWLDSPLASRNGWSDGPCEVLIDRGYKILENTPLPDEPAEAVKALRRLLTSPSTEGYRPVLVANGGTKLTSLALNAPMAGRAPMPLLYQQERPAEWWEMADGIAGGLVRRRFTTGRLSLKEVLACSGHIMVEEAGAKGQIRFWPKGPALANDTYGMDADESASAHDAAAERRATLNLLREKHVNGPMRFNDILGARPQVLKAFLKSAWEAGRCNPPAAPSNWQSFGKSHRVALAPVFDAAQQAAYEARKSLDRLNDRDDEPLGARLELAVARRLAGWLDVQRGAVPVTEAWLNVRVAPRNRPTQIAQELDVVLVLANGVLIALECKSFDVVRKDMDARTLNLQRSGSLPARLMLCAPLYCGFTDRNWFAFQHKARMSFSGPAGIHIPFTLPGQPVEYRFPNDRGEIETFTCDPFEVHLERLLQPYVPRSVDGA